MKIAVSACLLGQNCKYNGGNNKNERVLAFVEGHEVVPICPETAGGLSAPRLPAEIVGDRVVLSDGTDVTAAFRAGAARTLDTLQGEGVELVILKARSPSCGNREIYDGTFGGRLIAGRGVTAEAILAAGYRVMNEEEI